MVAMICKQTVNIALVCGVIKDNYYASVVRSASSINFCILVKNSICSLAIIGLTRDLLVSNSLVYNGRFF